MIVTKGYGDNQMIVTKGYGTHITIISVVTPVCRVMKVSAEDRAVVLS